MMTSKEAIEACDKLGEFLRKMNEPTVNLIPEDQERAVQFAPGTCEFKDYNIRFSDNRDTSDIDKILISPSCSEIYIQLKSKKKKYWKSLGDMINVFEQHGFKLSTGSGQKRLTNYKIKSSISIADLFDLADTEAEVFRCIGPLNFPLDLLLEER